MLKMKLNENSYFWMKLQTVKVRQKKIGPEGGKLKNTFSGKKFQNFDGFT